MNELTCPICKTDKNVLICMSEPTFKEFVKDGKPTWVFCSCVECGLTLRSKETLSYDEAVKDLTKKWNGLKYEEDN